MATTQLADVYDPEIWQRLAQEEQVERNAFLASGVAVSEPLITQKLSGGSDEITMPQFSGIQHGEPNYSSDDNTSFSTPKKITSQQQKARSASRNDSWAAMDLARELTDADPVAAINASIGGFWASDDEKRLLNSCVGILADNVANDGGDMVLDISNDDPLVSGEVPAENKLSEGTIILGMQTMGDRQDRITAIAMHSVQLTQLRLAGLVRQEKDPETNAFLYESVFGRRVVVDDSMPVEVGTNRITYTVMLFGTGAVGYGTGPVENPSEIERVASSGDGGGETIIYSRVNTCFHPFGFQFTGANVAGKFATYTELADEANWARVVARKNVAIAFIKVNG